MTATVRSSSSGYATAGSPFNIGRPSGAYGSETTPAPQAGDLIVLLAHLRQVSSSDTITTPTGFTVLRDSAGPNTSRTVVMAKIAGSSEPSNYPITYTTSNANGVQTWASVAIKPPSGKTWSTVSDAVAATVAGAAGSGSSQATPAVSGAPANALVLRLLNIQAGSATAPSSWTRTPTALASTGASGVRSASYFETADSSGASAANTATYSSAQYWISTVIALSDDPGPIAPANTAAPTVTGTPAVGQTLTGSDGTWNGNPTPTFSRQWQSSTDGGSTWSDISGGTGTTYTVASADAGKQIRYRVTGTNTNGTASASSVPSSVPAAPVNSVAPVITTDGSPATGETISVDNGTWTGANITYTYQWYRGAAPISGQTANTYQLAQTDEGASISCRVTATNGGGTATANSNTITPATTAPLSDASFLNYYSGGAGNTDPGASIGGARGGTFNGGLSGLFGPVPGSVAQSGGTFYRVLYVRNTHTQSTAAALKLFIESQFPASSGLTLAVAVPAEGPNTAVPALASGTTEPTGVTWVTTTDPTAGAAFGDLAPGAYRGLYLRLTVAPGSPNSTEVDATWAADGTAA